MRMLVVGAGATGGYFGGRLAQAGRDVTFLVRPGRAVHLRANGLQIVSPHGDAAITPRIVTASEIDGPYDIILLAVKAYTLDAAIADMAKAVGPQTMIVPMLNGMRHMDVLKQHFGAAAETGGVCKVAATIDEEGRIVQLAKFQELAYGRLDGSETPRVKELDAFMQGAGFTARLTPAIAREMWEKWVMLATLGGVTCLMRGNIGEISSAPGGVDSVLRLLDEVVSVVRAVGEAPSDTLLGTLRTQFTSRDSAMASSMYRDLNQGGPIEADQILGDLLVRGQAAGIHTPLLAAAYTQLAIHQARLAKQG